METTLVFLHGARQNKSLSLDADHYRIGAGSSCEIVLAGDTVDALHAVLERKGDDWQIVDRSRIGLLVNGQRAERMRLFDGDRVQIGSEHLFELRLRERSKQKQPQPPPGQPKPWYLSPWTFGLILLFYAVAGTGLYLIVSSSRSDGDAELTGARAQMLACLSRRHLERLSRDEKPDGPAVDMWGLDCRWPRQDQAHCAAGATTETAEQPMRETLPCERLRVDLAALGEQGEPVDGGVDRRIEGLDAAIRDFLGQAWICEARADVDAAIATYNKLVDCLPDLRLPATCFALERRRLLREASE
jgi:hypothetical protein